MRWKPWIAMGLALGMPLSGLAGQATRPSGSALYASNAGSVEFRAVGHPSALHVVGKGPGPQGRLTIGSQGVSGTLSFDLRSLSTGIAMRDEHMKKKYLEVDKYPQAELRITQLRPPSLAAISSGVPFEGVLRLHGVEKPVSGTVDLKPSGAHLLETEARFSLKLTDFGIEIPRFMGITIADEVHVIVDARAGVQF